LKRKNNEPISSKGNNTVAKQEANVNDRCFATHREKIMNYDTCLISGQITTLSITCEDELALPLLYIVSYL
jgi:hypothetical protein